MEKHQIVKHNAAIQATYNLTLTEMQMMYMCIAQIKRTSSSKNPRQFRIRHDEFCDEFGIKSSVYENMRAAAQKLQQRVITINEKVTISGVEYSGGAINVLSRQFWQEGEGEIMLEFSEYFMPYLELLNNNFTRFLMSDIAKMKSVYAMRFFELFKMHYEQQKNNKEAAHVVIKVDEIRRMFKLETKYKAHKDFKKRVIDAAVDEINRLSSLKVEYRQQKKGRRIHAYEFTIDKKMSKLQMKNTANKRARERAINELKKALELGQKVTILGLEVREINGAIVSFTNNTAQNIHRLMLEADCEFTVG